MPFGNRSYSDVISVPVPRWQRHGDDALDQTRGMPRPRTGSVTAAVGAAFSWVMTHVISSFALYATALHPEFVWPPMDDVPVDESDDARAIWRPWTGA